MDTGRSDNVYPSRGISPTLRSGPRQKRSDANADEIIRFVREYQKLDLPKRASVPEYTDYANTGAQSLKRKSVLPAIGGRSSHGDVMHLHNSYRTIEEGQMSMEVPDLSVHISVTDSGFVDKGSDPPDTDPPDTSSSEDHVESLDIHIDDDILHDDDFISLEKVDPFQYKQGVTIPRGRNGSILDLEEEPKQLNPHDVFVEDQLLSSRTRRSSKMLDNLMLTHNGSTPRNSHPNHSYLTAKPGPSHNFSNGVSRTGNLRRPRALPQLPPITKDEIPARPSAPSPSVTPPLPDSPLEMESFNAISHPEETNFYNDNFGYNTDGFRHPSGENVSSDPIDYIDCP